MTCVVVLVVCRLATVGCVAGVGWSQSSVSTWIASLGALLMAVEVAPVAVVAVMGALSVGARTAAVVAFWMTWIAGLIGAAELVVTTKTLLHVVAGGIGSEFST